MNALPREAQYAPAFLEPPVTLGVSSGSTWRWDPKRFGFCCARYKFVARMFQEQDFVAEIGAGDGFLSEIVKREVGSLFLFDFDPIWGGAVCDITKTRLPRKFDAIYMLDVIEHIQPDDEPRAMKNILASLSDYGVLIVGTPSLESQVYASPQSKKGHVNCRSGDQLRRDMQKYFRNVFLFGMNDEVLHVGFAPMCHYLLAVCTV